MGVCYFIIAFFITSVRQFMKEVNDLDTVLLLYKFFLELQWVGFV